MLLAVIPARGGSKGIPKKNLALLNGKPLLQYSIEVAQQSGVIDEILLSTDDDEIARLGHELGLDMRYRRPKALGADDSSMVDTLEHCIHWFKTDRGQLPDELLLLQPTSPLRSRSDIANAVALFREGSCRSVVSVHALTEHPSECIKGEGVNWTYLVTPRSGAHRRQDYERHFYFINGAIYLSCTDTLLSNRTFIYPGATALLYMPRDRGVDVDTPLDLIIAEAILRNAGQPPTYPHGISI